MCFAPRVRNALWMQRWEIYNFRIQLAHSQNRAVVTGRIAIRPLRSAQRPVRDGGAAGAVLGAVFFADPCVGTCLAGVLVAAGGARLWIDRRHRPSKVASPAGVFCDAAPFARA